MEFSVVIATRDRAAYLERALRSLQAQSGAPPFEAIVVDNGSSDGTRGLVEEIARGFESLRYVNWPVPNRGQARNRGVAVAAGRYVLFCDDDVALPEGWIAAHAAAHYGGSAAVVNGPILNVPSYESRPRPGPANYSRAFLCTCNASLSKAAFDTAGGFDEGFDLYGWEDTELGLRLRAAGLQWKFSWDAFLWHIKPPEEQTLEVESRKAIEKARMARRFLARHASARVRFATGAHAFNLVRGRFLIPDALLAMSAGLATSRRVPAWLGGMARAYFLDAIYIRELVRESDANRD
ncbi:MAG TPA: glycosyltransferase [Candidatus Cybelea sp.]|nr:glycosyltransferase [Candidatus Cybelea sp.]